jgi:hypothetical protein
MFHHAPHPLRHVLRVNANCCDEQTLEDNEYIKSMTLWATRKSRFASLSRLFRPTSRVARIDITTNQRSWSYGVDKTDGLSSKVANVGSGLLVGFRGRSEDYLDQLTPVFLKPVSESRIDNVTYDSLVPGKGLRLVTLREGSATWNGTDYQWNFAGSEEREIETTVSTSLALQGGFSIVITVLGSGISYTASETITFTKQNRYMEKPILAWSTTIFLSKELPSVSCVAKVWEARIDAPWTGLQTLSWEDNKSLTFNTKGSLRRVVYGNVKTACFPLYAYSSGSDNDCGSESDDETRAWKGWNEYDGKKECYGCEGKGYSGCESEKD